MFNKELLCVFNTHAFWLVRLYHFFFPCDFSLLSRTTTPLDIVPCDSSVGAVTVAARSPGRRCVTFSGQGCDEFIRSIKRAGWGRGIPWYCGLCRKLMMPEQVGAGVCPHFQEDALWESVEDMVLSHRDEHCLLTHGLVQMKKGRQNKSQWAIPCGACSLRQSQAWTSVPSYLVIYQIAHWIAFSQQP